ncbi:VCBS domain-containing protein [Bradyrhizobium diazoefficiens]|uniref:VCBS domain-containing protein n=1 Tax=Bradyrhizobium diazoefficiens TaxID=1355477 RepID=UPI00190BB264|nr:VCBS domain-containing protein [Bradyrhizobium diazoefficiens]MBK3661140.1 VCBS domain-containing protein [Bradyrhizobium diazoefficiens]
MDGKGPRSPADVHVDSFTAHAHGHVPEGAVVIPDPNLIFHGEFKRTGGDLVLSHDGREFVVHDYFRGDNRAAIASPDGAHLTGDIVSALTGYVQYAQAAPGVAAAQIIGHVTKLTGSATAIRNGVSVILNNGDNVEKGDVVSTGSDSTLGVTFIDGTVFGLSSNARMVLNEMVYDPNGSNNSSLLSLVAGTITFVAGETAKHGDMKVDTPVATMGIRGTAVLNQISFVIPPGGGDPQPQVSFQVLVEPNGTTGSYILFDKVTLLPIATVNQAGQMVQISGGNVSISNALLSPDVQKLITDVFTLKFTDNNTNTKLTTNFTDTITQNGNIVFIKTDTGAAATATFTNTVNNGSGPGQGGPDKGADRFPGAPFAQSLNLNHNVTSAFSLKEHANATGDHLDTSGDAVPPDTISWLITFVDQNLGDRPTVSVDLGDAPNYVYMDAGHHDVTGSLSALQKLDIAATQIQIGVVADGGNNNNGSAVLTYTIPDHAFDFLAEGETLTLAYKVRINDNFAVNPESTYITITITVTGTNDKPVITSSVPTITFEGGTSVPGGPLTTDVPTSGTLAFKDVDLTDTHSVSVKLTSASLPDGTVPPGPLAAFESAMSVAIATGSDSTGTGTGTINWSLADLPVYLADFIPKGEVLTLVYTVTVADEHGATSQQTITVTIKGTDAAAVVWIATNTDGAPPGGFWKDAANWETGTVPTLTDDVIVITDQLHGLTPSYPVTIDAAAYANSITMNDFGGPPPKVINKSVLTVAGALDMSADSIFTNTATGTMSVGGKAEILDTAVLTNAGYLTLAGGGDFASGTTITNSGTIELTGGTLKTLAEIHNAGGTLKADSGATLIVDAATVDGGTVTILGTLELDGTSLIENGTLNNFAAVNVKGTAEFANEIVANKAGGTIEVWANHALTIDQGSVVNNAGNVNVDASSKLTVNGATIDGGAIVILPGTPEFYYGVSDDADGVFIVTTGGPNVGTVTNNGEIDLTGNAVISYGILKNNAAIDVIGIGNALDGEIVSNSSTGTIEVLANGALTIDQGSSVTNTGNLTVDATGKLTVNGASISGAGTVTDNGEIDLTGNAVLNGGALKNNATFKVSGIGNALDDETITNASTGTIEVLANGALTIDQGSSIANIGNVTVDATGKLTVNGASISGAGTVTDNGEIDLTGNAVLSGGALKNNATFDVSGIGNALDNETLTNAGTIEVLTNGALAIDQGSTVDNSSGDVVVDANAALTLSDATIAGGTINGSGTIEIAGASTIDGGATLSVAAVTADAKLTLDGVTVSGTVITDNASIELDNTVKLKDSAEIKGGPVANKGTLEIAGAATLLNDVVTNTGHIVKVDDSQALTLSGTEITGGTINNYSGALGAMIDVTGNSTIDGQATLNKGAVTVESGFALTLNDATVAGTAIANYGTVKVETAKKLTMNGASLTGGALTVSGTVDSLGTSTITNANISNSSLIEAIGGVLALVATTSATIANDGGTIQAKGGELDINGEGVTNTGTLAAIDDGTLKLISMKVTNAGGAVSIESGSTLDLNGATIDGGTMTIGGTLESTGTSAITEGDITNTGTITVTGGTLTIDPAVLHTISNSHLIQANGGELDIAGELLTNTADIKAINGGILKLSAVIVTNSGGTVTVDGTSKLYLSNLSAINGGSLSNSGHLYGVSGSNSVTAAVSNTGTIEVQGGTLNLSGGLSGAGSLVIDDGATLELAGATAQTVTFAGGADTLQLDKVAGQSFTGTITGQSSAGGTFTVTGAADITTASGDALDFAASGGTLAKPADIVLTPTGALKGAANGIAVTQNGTGNISLTATKDVTGLAGNGITLRDSATGAGDITVNDLTGKATGAGANSVGVLVENLNSANAGDISITQRGGAVSGAFGIDATTQGDGNITIDAGGTITGSSIYGIRARSYGAGSETVTTKAGSIVTSGSSGIVAANRATSVDASDASTITVNAYGTINSGSSLNQSGNTPGGIQAGYNGATTGSVANAAVNGSVTINNYANVTAAGGFGLHAYNYGVGDVTVSDGAGTTVIGANQGIRAQALNGGAGDVDVMVGANAHVTGTASYAIFAYSIDAGDIRVTMSSGDVLNSGSSGIVAVNYATAIASSVDSTIVVKAHGTINSGTTLNDNGTTPGGIIAGYNPNGNSTFSNLVNGDVTVESDATINAATGFGIEAFTWGIGDVTVTTGATSSITASGGAAIGAVDHGGGDVGVTNEGSAAGAVGLSAFANGAGDVTIVNDGDLTGTGTVGINVTQNAAGATGSTHITNTGSVLGADGYAAIYVQENTHGTALIDNSGTIGPDDAGSVVSTTYAIFETGGAITIKNSNHINGNISVASATFDNESAGTWTVSGTSVFGTLSTIDNAGEIDLLDGASVSSADGLTFAISNSGKIESWGTASITGNITNANTIEIHTDGTLSLFGSLSGSGSVTIDTGATLDVDGTVSQTVTFNGGGSELRIDTSSFGGSVAGFAATDKLDLSTIKFDVGTSSTYDAATGNLVVSDAYGHSITVKLTGTDYSSAHFAGSSDGHGGTLITLNAVDDAPALTAAEAPPSLSFAELDNKTGYSTTMDPASGGTGTIHFGDIDLTERPTAKITHQDVSWLAADHTTSLTLTPDETSALEHALTLQQTGNKNNGTVGWTYSIADSSLDFLGQGQTATVVSTIELRDHNGGCDTAQVTITIAGANDAPTVAAVTAGPLVDTAAADTFSDLTGQLVGTDADTGETATLSYAVLDADSHAVTTLAGHYGSLTVNSDGTYSYAAGAAAIDALSEGSYHDTFTVQTTDAHGTTGTATLTVDVTGANDAPAITAEAGDSAGASVNESNAGLDKSGTLTVSDADTGDHVSVALDHVSVYLDGHLQTDDVGGLSNADLLNYLTIQSGDILDGTATHAQFSWEFNSGDQAFDFLAAGHTLSLQYTIAPNDGHTSGTADIVTINIAGSNDSPTLDNATLGAISEDTAAPAGSTVGKLFAAGFHDVDDGSNLSAVAITADHAMASQGVWQYEVAGSNQWIDISGVSDTGALVLATDTLIRFEPAANYSGVPGSLDVHALDDTYGGGVSGDTPVLIDITSSGTVSSVSAQAATLNTEVTPVADAPAFTAMAVNYVADSLTGNSIDLTKWQIVLPSVPGTADDASVTPTANGVVLHDHGYLETTSGFTPTAATPLHVSLSFSLDDGVGPYVAVTDGTDGTTGAFGSPANGLSFMFGWGHGLVIANNATGEAVNLSAGLSQGTVYDASITDDGSHQTVVIVDHGTGETVGTYTSDFSDYAAGNLVTITNREANDSQHDATVSNVTVSNAFEGEHGVPIALSGLTAVTDTDGSEHMSLDLSGFPDGTTFSVGQAGTGAEAGHWLISSSDISSLGASPLTMTAPADYIGEFSLHVSGTVVDQATGLSGPLSETETFTNDVAVKVDGDAPVGGPVIDTDNFTVSHDHGLGTDTIYNLSVTDGDSGAPTDTFTVTASTSPTPSTDTSSVDVPTTSGSLNDINLGLANGVTYTPGDPAPDQDHITLTVTDKTTGLSDTVNFIFNEGDASQGVTLNGTAGKDVIFATTTGDTLSGNGGKDQFVFAPGSAGFDDEGHPVADYSHTITDFIEGVDRIDLRQFSDVSSIHGLTITQQSGDTLIDWQQQVGVGEGSVTEHEQLLLKSVTATLKASDFIFHIT